MAHRMSDVGCWMLINTLLIACGRAQQPDFIREVQPVLESRCWGCHGPKLQMHGLRLDRRADALKGGGSGVPAIVPGKSAQSLLIKYVSGLDRDVIMRPAGERLKRAEIETLRTWIDSGAAWPGQEDEKPAALRSDHWSFQPIARPRPPDVNSAWVRNPIDAF